MGGEGGDGEGGDGGGQAQIGGEGVLARMGVVIVGEVEGELALGLVEGPDAQAVIGVAMLAQTCHAHDVALEVDYAVHVLALAVNHALSHCPAAKQWAYVAIVMSATAETKLNNGAQEIKK